MEAKSSQPTSNIIQNSLMLRNYKEFADRLIESTCEKIIDTKKIAEHVTTQVPARKEGHLNIVAEQLRQYTVKVLSERMGQQIEKLKTDLVDNLIFKEQHCHDVEECSFDEEQEFYFQVGKALDTQIDRVRKMREEQQRLDPL